MYPREGRSARLDVYPLGQRNAAEQLAGALVKPDAGSVTKGPG